MLAQIHEPKIFILHHQLALVVSLILLFRVLLPRLHWSVNFYAWSCVSVLISFISTNLGCKKVVSSCFRRRAYNIIRLSRNKLKISSKPLSCCTKKNLLEDENKRQVHFLIHWFIHEKWEKEKCKRKLKRVNFSRLHVGCIKWIFFSPEKPQNLRHHQQFFPFWIKFSSFPVDYFFSWEKHSV